MPSVNITNQSGGMLIISGSFLSGYNLPMGGIQFRADKNNSGNIFVGLSGGVTVTSGGYPLSGGIYSGALDGMQLSPGDSYFVPRLSINNRGAESGTMNVYAACDAVSSGFSRIFFEVF